MVARRLDFTGRDAQAEPWEAGSDTHVVILCNDDDGPIPMTGNSARMHIRDAYNSSVIALDLTTENARIVLADGRIEIIVDNIAMTTLIAGRPTKIGSPPFVTFVYDFEMVIGAVVERWFEGKINVKIEVTRP